MVLWSAPINNAQMVEGLNKLVHLNYNIAASCEAALDTLSDADSQKLVADLKAMHHRHAGMLAEQVRVLGGAPVEGEDWRQWVTRGRTGVAALGGGKNVSGAMQTNEEQLYQAYTEAVHDYRASDEVVDVINQVLDDGQGLRSRLSEASRSAPAAGKRGR